MFHILFKFLNFDEKKRTTFFLSFLFQNFIFKNHLSDWKKMKWRFNKKTKKQKTMISHFHQMETCEGFLLKYKMWNCLHFIFFFCCNFFCLVFQLRKLKLRYLHLSQGQTRKMKEKEFCFYPWSSPSSSLSSLVEFRFKKNSLLPAKVVPHAIKVS